MPLTKLTALYKRTDKRGQMYLTGGLGMANITIMANTYKTADGQPDYYLCLIPNSEAQEAK